MKVTVLAGGTGGAMLAQGFYAALPAGSLSVVTNTGDDLEQWGLHVAPDTDAVLYRLAGLFDEERHWGVLNETFSGRDMFGLYGEETWFGLGDRDLATHVLRTELLRRGLTLEQATAELAGRLELHARIIPASDQPVRTFIDTDEGRFTLQEYFVRERLRLPATGVTISAKDALPSAGATEALLSADLIVIGPSNPVVSIDPILAVVRDLLEPARTVAVTPVIGGRALKGPTMEMLRSLGREATPQGIARHYRDVASGFVVDTQDADQAEAIEAQGMRVQVTDTVMGGPPGRQRLAQAILDFWG